MTRDELLAELLVERYATTERNLPEVVNEPAERRAWSDYSNGVRGQDPATEDQIRAYRRRAMQRSRARREGAA